MSEIQRIQTAFPVLPLKNAVLFPYLLMPLSVGRESSVAAVHAALETDEKEIVLFSQKDPTVENAGPDDLHTIGTRAVIRKMSQPNDENIELLVLGVERVAVVKFEQTEPYLQARVRPLPLPEDKSAELEALQGALMDLAAKAIALAQPNAPQEIGRLLAANDDPLRLSYVLASMFSMDVTKTQALLEADSRVDALRL